MARRDAPVNEWGIPDWRKPEEYGCTARWELDRWRWEFTRRWSDYRADFEVAFCKWAAMTLVPSDIERAFEARDRWDLIRVPASSRESAAKYGLTCFFDPMVSDWARPGDSKWNGPVWRGTGFQAHRSRRPLHPDTPHLVPCCFDVSRPIEPQLKQAAAELRAWQVKLTGYGAIKLRKPKLHRAKWSTYLRVLDAREAGASLSQVAGVLPENDSEEPGAKFAHNALKQAQAIFRF